VSILKAAGNKNDSSRPECCLVGINLLVPCAASGTEALRDFGQPPLNKVEYEESDSPAVDSHGQPAARAAMEGVAEGQKPGEDISIGHVKGGPALGSGNAPIGMTALQSCMLETLVFQHGTVKIRGRRIWS